ncbi:MAG: ribonuclease T, partial [Pseudomonadota bacterium]
MKKSPLLNLILLVLLAVSVLWLYWPDSNGGKDEPSENADYVLAVSWQPAFCEKRPNVRECRSQRAGRFDVENFSLHGLWPQPHGNIYCDVPSNLVSVDKQGKWRNLPNLDLSDALRNELSIKMPGYQSGLHRHEWFKHGTCMHGVSPEEYFRISLDLLDQLNNSGFRDLIKQNTGRKLSFRDIEQPFIKAFGKGANN